MKGLIFTYVLTYGGSVAAVVNPWIGFLVYVCFAIIKPHDLWHWSVPEGNYSRVVAIALLVGWAMHGFGGFRFGPARPIVTALVAFLAWALLSGLLSTSPETAWKFVELMAKIVLPVVVGATIIDSVAKLRQLAWTIVLSQGYLAYDLNRTYFEGFNRLHEEGFAKMDNNCVAISMVAAAALAFCFGLTERRWWAKLIAFAAAGLMAHCVMFAYSRGGMLGLIVTGFVIFVIMPKEPKHYAFFIIAVVIALRLAGAEVLQRFSSAFVDENQRDYSAQSRLDTWRACFTLIQENPLTGIGPDHFPLVSDRFGFEHGKEAHSLWMQTGAELGIPGLGFLLAYYGLCVARLWPLERAGWRGDPWLPTAARMVIASLIGFGVSAQFVSLEALELPYYVALLGAGAIKLAGPLGNSHGARRPHAGPTGSFA